MPKTSKETASKLDSISGILENHFEELDGYTVSFESHTGTMDGAPFFRGLPDDRCQCPHWGYVINGKITFRFADRDETYVAGDAYYVPPGHTPVVFAGGEVVSFSPTDKLVEAMDVFASNLATSEHP
jgi:hypothetical protein